MDADERARLTEMLRGTDSWTPYVAPSATAGSPLVTGSVAVLATTLVAAGGLAGLALTRMPARGRLITMLLVGVVLLGAGYSGGLGSPIAHAVQAFLDADGTPLRNLHKLEPLLRLPLTLGLAHLLGRIPLPGSAPTRVWRDAFAHPENDKRVAVGIVLLSALTAATALAWTGRLTPPGAFDAIPPYWHDAAQWLDDNNSGGRVLVAPGAPFATQIWGNSHDEPLQVLGDSAWGVRDSILLTPPETIRALDHLDAWIAEAREAGVVAVDTERRRFHPVVARWIAPAEQDEAAIAGATVVTPMEVLSTHLMETVKANLPALFTLSAMQRLIQELKSLSDEGRAQSYQRLFDNMIPDKVAPDLLLAIKKTVDEDYRPGRFLLTGSANVLTLPRVSDSLAGRMETIQMLPLARAEIEGRTPAFLERLFGGKLQSQRDAIIGDDLTQLVLLGGFPEAISRDSERRRSSFLTCSSRARSRARCLRVSSSRSRYAPMEASTCMIRPTTIM